jgi:hypothetical protein
MGAATGAGVSGMGGANRQNWRNAGTLDVKEKRARQATAARALVASPLVASLRPDFPD